VGAPAAPDLPIADRGDEVGRSRGVAALVGTLKQRLAANPKDVDSWLLLGRTYGTLGRPVEGADALKHAIDAGDARPATASAYGEALVEAADGMVTPGAEAAFRGPAAAGDPRARYFLAQGRFQHGDIAGALADWTGLVEASPPDAPWLPAVRERLATAAKALGRPVPDAKPQGAPAVAAATPDAGAAAAPPAQQQAMIAGMVARLADRLKQNPADVDGWMKLGRSYQVMGRPEESIAAYAEAATRAPKRLDAVLAYAHALYPPGESDRPPPQTFLDLMHAALDIDPDQAEALWFVGRDAADHGDRVRAVALFTKLRDRLPEASDARAAVERELQRVGQATSPVPSSGG
jgi:cytochrome c-type biogenesis protein CcmH